MKSVATLFLSGAALTSAAAIARSAEPDSCPATVKTLYVSHIELSEFTVAHTWSWDEAKKWVEDSKPDLSQVYPELNFTRPVPGGSYSTGGGLGGSSSSGTYPVSEGAPSTGSTSPPFQTGGNNGTVIESSGSVFPTEVSATSSSGAASATASTPSASGSASSASGSASSASGSASSASVSSTSGSASASSSSASVTSGSASASSSSASVTSSSASASSSSASVTSSSASSTSSSVSSSSSSAAPTATGCTSPRTRVEWRNLSDNQRDSYVSAIQCLMTRPSTNTRTFPGSMNLFEDLVSLHQQLVGGVHNSGLFLVWHRYYINVYHSLLTEECGYTGPYVWWDERRDAGNFANAPMFTARWFGELSASAEGRGACVMETGFGAYQPNLGPNTAINNPHCLSRAVDENLTLRTNSDWFNNCAGAQNYDAFRSCSELTYHAYGHNGVGSVMSNVATSPEDPLFFLHHGFIDYGYKVWQNGGSTRNMEVGGPNASGGTLTPTAVLTSRGLRPDVTVADVLDAEGDYLCYVYDTE